MKIKLEIDLEEAVTLYAGIERQIDWHELQPFSRQNHATLVSLRRSAKRLREAILNPAPIVPDQGTSATAGSLTQSALPGLGSGGDSATLPSGSAVRSGRSRRGRTARTRPATAE